MSPETEPGMKSAAHAPASPRARITRVATPTVRVVPKHHALVRLSHWANVPLLLGLSASGLAIYWAAPVFLHAPDPATGSRDYLRDLGIAAAHLFHDGGDPRGWLYNRISLGTQALADSLRLHWALAYLFMLNGVLYVIGLIRGGGWRALLPRPSDVADALAMMRYYAGVIPMALLRRPWPHPPVRSKYNALQRGAYFTMPVVGALAVLSGWAMHKPAMLGWLERLFVNYNGARIVHFICMAVLTLFLVPHVALVIADGWDTFRSMVTGWSARLKESSHD
ncbi:MAG: cytochrome b/b6 domain-containing protein [Gaiellaceae bacterium]